jgi:hypothetical protein
MNPKDYDAYVNHVRKMLHKHRSEWYRMDRAGVASYRWSVKFAETGEIKNPQVHKLAQVEEYLSSVAA